MIRSAGLIAMLTMASGACHLRPAPPRCEVFGPTPVSTGEHPITNVALDTDFGGTGNVQLKGPRAIDRGLIFLPPTRTSITTAATWTHPINHNQSIVTTDTFTILSNPSASLPSPGPITIALNKLVVPRCHPRCEYTKSITNKSYWSLFGGNSSEL
jgi:hypothetical protein